MNIINFAGAENDLIPRITELVTRMEKAIEKAPAKFVKSTIVDISDLKLTKDKYRGYNLTGKVTNNTGIDLDKVRIEFNLYDKDGNTIQSMTSDYLENVKNGTSSNLETSIYKEGVSSVEVKTVSVEINVN